MGISTKVISEHLGHCDTRTTENIYAHVFAETLAQTSDAISQALAREGEEDLIKTGCVSRHCELKICYRQPLHLAVKNQRRESACSALQISCVIVPIGQYTHHERGLNNIIVTNPSTVDVSMTL